MKYNYKSGINTKVILSLDKFDNSLICLLTRLSDYCYLSFILSCKLSRQFGKLAYFCISHYI